MSFAFVQIMFIVCSVLDLCRVGSLENQRNELENSENDLCRVGSLERDINQVLETLPDLCRVGSLEIAYSDLFG